MRTSTRHPTLAHPPSHHLAPLRSLQLLFILLLPCPWVFCTYNPPLSPHSPVAPPLSLGSPLGRRGYGGWWKLPRRLGSLRQTAHECPETCPVSLNPVCGDNNVTYRTECTLKRVNCSYGTDIQILYDVSCEEAKHAVAIPQSCTTRCLTVWKPVCGTNHKSYLNECSLKKQACLDGIFVQVKHTGPCEDHEKPTNGSCSKPCSTSWKPVCGTDGMGYHNECLLKRRACEVPQLELTVLSQGLCGDQTPTSNLSVEGDVERGRMELWEGIGGAYGDGPQGQDWRE
eukprot:GHVQ01022061.1.p1 GENE.GHVQ01022061.1~~GHVQ01022061.1.p1  ORF type:complete len:298 (+),score=40.21 GHVQ01022061.1:42-896(+)